MPSTIIFGRPYDIPDLYVPGHPLSPGEAVALNSLRRTRIREIFIKALDEGEVPAGVEKEALAHITRGFQFPLPNGARATDPLDRIAWRMAQDLAGEELRRRGRERGDMLDGQWSELVSRIASSPSVRAEAARRLAASREIAEDVLDLGDFGS
jgi:hypothetical protein